jgi:hypothetical protein
VKLSGTQVVSGFMLYQIEDALSPVDATDAVSDSSGPGGLRGPPYPAICIRSGPSLAPFAGGTIRHAGFHQLPDLRHAGRAAGREASNP